MKTNNPFSGKESDIKAISDHAMKYCAYLSREDRGAKPSKETNFKIEDPAKEPQDIAQDALLKFCKSQSYDPSKSKTAYINKITVNVLKSEHEHWESKMKGERRDDAVTTVSRDADSDSDSDPEPAIYMIAEPENHMQDLLYDIKCILPSLPERQRKIMELRYSIGDNLEELTQEETANLLGITRQTVISDEKKALSFIRKCLGISRG